MVDSVRVQRAIEDFFTRSPNTGMRSISRSMKICTARERFQAARKPQMAPMMVGKMTYQYETNQSDMAITRRVGAGRSAPKLRNTSLNAGITKIMITAVIMKATAMIAIG